MKTLFLDPTTWDLTVDAAGNVAVADDPYALAQDAASAIRLSQGELWYDTAQGIPYRDTILGKTPPLSLIKQKFVTAALSVPGVTAAQVFITGIKDRRLTGQVQVTDKTGQIGAVDF